MESEKFKEIFDSVKPALLQLDSLVYPNSLKEIVDRYELEQEHSMQKLEKAFNEFEAQEQREQERQREQIQSVIEKLNQDNARIKAQIEDLLQQVKYISIEADAKWPVFHLNDKLLNREFMEECENNNADLRKEKLFELVDKHCNQSFWADRTNRWKKSKIIKAERMPLFEEALILYNQGFYYGTTTILICQIYGIAGDISSYIKKQGFELSDGEKMALSKHYSIAYQDIDKEKGKLLQSLYFVYSGAFIWGKMYSYLRDEILCSSESKERWATQPLRNKICHGDQINFGTREHALKALLITDMLLNYSQAVDWKIKKEKELLNDGCSKKEMG